MRRNIWVANDLIEHLNDPTEPKLYPHKYTEFVQKSAYDELMVAVKRVGLQCANIGQYGFLKISPGECPCWACNLNSVLSRHLAQLDKRDEVKK